MLSANVAHAAKGDGDARIRTLVYNDAEVFRVVMRNGFQTDLELAADETIDTLSIGDSIGWQITPASHRIFIKPLQRTGVTNLSVITNKRTYQFELVATNPTTNTPDHAYVVKFYYPENQNGGIAAPEDRTRGYTRPVSQTAIPELPNAVAPTIPSRNITPPTLPGDTSTQPMMPPMTSGAPSIPEPPVMPGDVKVPAIPMNAGVEGFNFNYTLSGPEEGAPIKIYDDGKSTFFQFKGTPSPALNFAALSPDGTEVQLPARPDGSGKVIVDQVAGRFTIRDGASLVCVFNEQNPAASISPVTAARP